MTGEGWSDVSRGSDIKTLFDTLITIGFEQNLSAYCGKTVLIEVYSNIRIICDIFRQSKFAFFESVYDVAIPN